MPGIRLLDPNVVSPTFEQLQQVRGFYSFPETLDVDRYEVDGEEQDTVIAVREINIDGIPPTQQNWLNQATVVHPRLRRRRGARQPAQRRRQPGLVGRGHPAAGRAG